MGKKDFSVDTQCQKTSKPKNKYTRVKNKYHNSWEDIFLRYDHFHFRHLFQKNSSIAQPKNKKLARKKTAKFVFFCCFFILFKNFRLNVLFVFFPGRVVNFRVQAHLGCEIFLLGGFSLGGGDWGWGTFLLGSGSALISSSGSSSSSSGTASAESSSSSSASSVTSLSVSSWESASGTVSVYFPVKPRSTKDRIRISKINSLVSWIGTFLISLDHGLGGWLRESLWLNVGVFESKFALHNIRALISEEIVEIFPVPVKKSSSKRAPSEIE